MKSKIILILFLLGVNLYAGKLWVDNFDDGSDPNLVGGSDYGAIGGGSGSMGYQNTRVFRGNYGYGITYNINTASGQYGYILFSASPSIDLRSYKNLVLWLRGAKGGEHLNLYLEDDSGKYARVDVNDYLTIRSNDWQKLVVPLTVFRKHVDGGSDINLASIKYIKVSIEKVYGLDFSENSTIYFDDLYFTDEFELGTYPVDNFDNGATVPNGVNNNFEAAFATFGSGSAGIYTNSSIAHSGNGVYRANYGLASGQYAYVLFYLNHLKATNVNYINLWVKGSNAGGEMHFWIGYGASETHLGSMSNPANWTLVSLPLTGLSVNDKTNLSYIKVSWEGVAQTNTTYIDDISLSKWSNRNDIPLQPSGLGVTSRTESKIIVHWSPNSENDIQFYKIFRSKNNTNSFRLIEMVPANITTLTDANGINDYSAYYYKVVAVDGEYPAKESPASTNLYVPPLYSATITNTTLYGQAGVGKNKLWWNKINTPNLAGYRVYRSTESGTNYSLIATLLASVTNYIDENVINGTTYYYIVKGVNSSGQEGLPSNEVSLTPFSANEYQGAEPFYLPANENILKVSKAVFNPEKESIIIGYNLIDKSFVLIKVYDLQGRLIDILKDESYGEKLNRREFIEWQGKNIKGEKISSGVYILIIQSDNFSQTRKVVIVR